MVRIISIQVNFVNNKDKCFQGIVYDINENNMNNKPNYNFALPTSILSERAPVSRKYYNRFLIISNISEKYINVNSLLNRTKKFFILTIR